MVLAPQFGQHNQWRFLILLLSFNGIGIFISSLVVLYLCLIYCKVFYNNTYCAIIFGYKQHSGRQEWLANGNEHSHRPKAVYISCYSRPINNRRRNYQRQEPYHTSYDFCSTRHLYASAKGSNTQPVPHYKRSYRKVSSILMEFKFIDKNR